jgi:hypothetical protein
MSPLKYREEVFARVGIAYKAKSMADMFFVIRIFIFEVLRWRGRDTRESGVYNAYSKLVISINCTDIQHSKSKNFSLTTICAHFPTKHAQRNARSPSKELA